MASRYKFSEEEIKAIEQGRKGNKKKRAEVRLKALDAISGNHYGGKLQFLKHIVNGKGKRLTLY